MDDHNIVRINVGGVEFIVSRRNWATHVGHIPDLLNYIDVSFIDRDPAIFPVFLTYIRGYDLDYDFIKQAGMNSGYLPNTFYSMLYQDCQVYKIPEVTKLVEYFLLENLPTLLDNETIQRLTNSKIYRDITLNLYEQNTDIMKTAKEYLEIGDLELDDNDTKMVECIDKTLKNKTLNYPMAREHNEFLKNLVGRKKSRYKIKGMFPQILIWITTTIYKWLGIQNSKDTLTSKIRMFLRKHPSAVDELCDSIDHIGWERAEPLLDYAMMAAVDVATKDKPITE